MRVFSGMFAIVCIAVAVGAAAAQAPTPTPKPFDYDAFCKLPDEAAKRDMFQTSTPAIRADIVRTQMERWRDANKSKLTDKQLAALGNLIAAITPDTYGTGPKADEQREKAKALQPALMELFTMDQIQAMQPSGPCIAKAK